LPWAEAEALTVTDLAARLGWPASARVKGQATRDWLLQALEQGQVVTAACHGVFDQQDVLRSRLLLARGETLTLADLLSRVADLRGLRLLLLSGCQTALLDVRGARDEVQSLAAGMLQAGAQAVLGVLWPVEDEAAYLLTVRFVQEWLPRLEIEPPAAALARAQQWLRTVTHRDLRSWRAEALPGAGRAAERGAHPLSQRGRLRRVRGRGLRLELHEAERRLRAQASGEEPDACPFANPIHWAGFHLIGW
jgi:CHAT domain-containing protein